jgi:hypothetical protein
MQAIGARQVSIGRTGVLRSRASTEQTKQWVSSISTEQTEQWVSSISTKQTEQWVSSVNTEQTEQWVSSVSIGKDKRKYKKTVISHVTRKDLFRRSYSIIII